MRRGINARFSFNCPGNDYIFITGLITITGYAIISTEYFANKASHNQNR